MPSWLIDAVLVLSGFAATRYIVRIGWFLACLWRGPRFVWYIARKQGVSIREAKKRHDRCRDQLLDDLHILVTTGRLPKRRRLTKRK